MAKPLKWILAVFAAIVVLLVLVFDGLVGYLAYIKLPQSAAGITAKAVCSGAFVAGRDPASIYDADVIGASPALGIVSVDIDTENYSVTATAAGIVKRTASLQPDRGCVLDTKPNPDAKPYVPTINEAQAWPVGDAALPQSQWPRGVDADALNAIVEQAFVGAGDIQGANARAVAVAQNGQLLVAETAPGFGGGVALHGWSMTKSVGGMLVYKVMMDNKISLDTPVVDTFTGSYVPEWVADWKKDERANITVKNLFQMTDGLANVEGYTPFDATVRMLNSEGNMAQYAAEAPAEYPAGTSWNYTSQTANILADVARGQFANDQDYWTYPSTQLFQPLGTTSATLETDTAGTWVNSSYLWADIADWMRFGQLGLQDGQWNGQQVLPAGWLEFASESALPEGLGAGYSAQSWLPGNPVGGECRNLTGFPEDMVAFEGHWGQKIAIIPSKNAVIARLGWTFDSDQFNWCEFLNEVNATLPATN